jgi:hypothetical protein
MQRLDIAVSAMPNTRLERTAEKRSRSAAAVSFICES